MDASSQIDPLAHRPNVLVLSSDAVGKEMAGPGIRAFELAQVLADHAKVTLAAPAVEGSAPLEAAHDRVLVTRFDAHDPASIREQLANTDVVIAPPLWPRLMRAVRHSGAQTIFDLYVPEPLETIEHMRSRDPRLRRLMYALALDRLDEALHGGHRFVCASEKQRDLWLGALLGARLISPMAYDRDPSLRSVIDVVPFGVPSEAARSSSPGPRERFQLADDDPLVLWNGGLWSWLDAPTAIRAIARVVENRPRTRLVFMGASDLPPARRAREEAETIAREAGMLDHVIFNDGWVPYDERASWLLQADCALSTHRDHLETRFAFRTRLLDCFWAGLPVVCTDGDDLGARVARDGLGATAPAGDVDAVAGALESVLSRGRESYTDALSRAATDYEWSRVAEPLVRWVTQPDPKPSKLGRSAHGGGLGQRVRGGGYRGARRLLDALGLRGWPRL